MEKCVCTIKENTKRIRTIMIRSTYSIVAIAIIATTCMASNINNDVMLPNLDLGLSIDEQNVEMIQVKESVKKVDGPGHDPESDEELFKEGCPTGGKDMPTGAATGGTGVTGAMPCHVNVVSGLFVLF